MKRRACRSKLVGLRQQAGVSEKLSRHEASDRLNPFHCHQTVLSRLWSPAALAAFVFAGTLSIQAAETAPGPAAAFGPMYYLETFGSPGHEIRLILLALTWLSIAVVIIITALVVIGVIRRGRWVEDMRADRASVAEGQNKKALRWIYAGLVATVGTLLVFVGWTVSTMAAINSPSMAPAATIEVTGHQWWWEVVYKDAEGAVLVRAANEIRVPVGHPVRFVLRSTDVIHSFWVPLLGGKTDMIPGQENVAWLRADRAGVYRGQCVEYCGLQHAQMGFQLVAIPPEEFDAWLADGAATARAGGGLAVRESPSLDVQNSTAELQRGGGDD